MGGEIGDVDPRDVGLRVGERVGGDFAGGFEVEGIDHDADIGTDVVERSESGFEVGEAIDEGDFVWFSGCVGDTEDFDTDDDVTIGEDGGDLAETISDEVGEGRVGEVRMWVVGGLIRHGGMDPGSCAG